MPSAIITSTQCYFLKLPSGFYEIPKIFSLNHNCEEIVCHVYSQDNIYI